MQTKFSSLSIILAGAVISILRCTGAAVPAQATSRGAYPCAAIPSKLQPYTAPFKTAPVMQTGLQISISSTEARDSNGWTVVLSTATAVDWKQPHISALEEDTARGY